MDEYDNYQPITADKGLYISFRPFLKESLLKLNEQFELIIFTASDRTHALTALKGMEEALGLNVKTLFKHVLFRSECIRLSQFNLYLKDLSLLLSNRRLEDIVIIDNKILSYAG